jgi:hypothetical protein
VIADGPTRKHSGHAYLGRMAGIVFQGIERLLTKYFGKNERQPDNSSEGDKASAVRAAVPSPTSSRWNRGKNRVKRL